MHFKMRSSSIKTINKDNIGEITARQGFFSYRSVKVIRARLMEGRFTVEASEGKTTVEHGYLVIDDNGDLYGVSFEEFTKHFHSSRY